MQFSDAINKDMIWQLGDKRYRERSVNFLTRFKESLCLFSSSVKQLYSNYDLFTDRGVRNRVVAMPNPYAYYDIYNDIPKDAVKPTGMYVVPTEILKQYSAGDLCLVYRSNATGEIKSIPLKEGLRKLRDKYKDEDRFLPLILNKDLKMRKDHKPVMHLHRLDLDALSHISDFQKRDLVGAIEDKMNALLH